MKLRRCALAESNAQISDRQQLCKKGAGRSLTCAEHTSIPAESKHYQAPRATIHFSNGTSAVAHIAYAFGVRWSESGMKSFEIVPSRDTNASPIA